MRPKLKIRYYSIGPANSYELVKRKRVGEVTDLTVKCKEKVDLLCWLKCCFFTSLTRQLFIPCYNWFP